MNYACDCHQIQYTQDVALHKNTPSRSVSAQSKSLLISHMACKVS